MVGLGGGVFYTPMQILAGVGFNDAVTTSLILILVTSLSSSFVFYKKGLVVIPFVVVAELFTASGSFLAGYFSGSLNQAFLMYFLIGILFLNSYLMIKPPNYEPMKLKDSIFNFSFKLPDGIEMKMNLLYVGPAFFLAGAISALVGIGGGALKLPVMIVLLGFPIRFAIANSAAMIVFTSIFALLGRASQAEIDWKFGLMAASVVFIGSRAGAKVSLGTDPKKVKKDFRLCA